MEGYPKHLNSKQDYYYVSENFPRAQWENDWKALLEDQKVWINIGTIKMGEEGVVDDTHKVFVQKETDGTETRYQYAYVDNENNIMKNIGMTIAEVETLLN